MNCDKLNEYFKISAQCRICQISTEGEEEKKQRKVWRY